MPGGVSAAGQLGVKLIRHMRAFSLMMYSMGCIEDVHMDA